ncbi:MAG: alcohol dehydrogenase catalytic domain-containing protein, partial [Rhodobacteraceae bacterium]|nr:alcohol dehydrogenase catalytic domain-containing protein [Paracoccaceae bacterium]
MKAMALVRRGEPLQPFERDLSEPGPGEIRVKVTACGVCRTDLHLLDDELPNVQLPIIPGHEVVGTVDKTGKGVATFVLGDRVGIPWLGKTCRKCFYCRNGRENLCDQPSFTGYTIDGGYAEYITADERYCFPLPGVYDDAHAAPLLCAGLIGYRSLKAAGPSKHIGLYGFGAAAHICAQVAAYQNKKVYAFTRPGDQQANAFAIEMGACWAGSSLETPPHPLDAAIIFAPVGSLLPTALRAVRKGGTVVCGGIHMSDIPTFP